jgi:hypothetical protein
MKNIVYFLVLSLPLFCRAQSLPYAELPVYAETYSAGKLAARTIDGLGFRFYWATEGLRDEDLAYKPGQDARTSLETIQHIYEMSFIITNAALKKTNTSSQPPVLPFADMRKKVLENLKTASDILQKSSDEDMKTYNITFTNKDGKTTSLPFWNLINGPIEDSVWHVGQIVSFRRSSGNPFSEKVNVFTGTVAK